MQFALLDPAQTAQRLSYPALVEQLRALLADATVQVPQRLVQALPGGGSLFVMPAFDSSVAITKLITFTPGNAGTGRPTIQGDVVVFDVTSGERRLVLDGPTVTARRTAAVSLLAAQQLAPNRQGPLLVVGAGAQGFAHVEAFVQGLGVREVLVVSRSAKSRRNQIAFPFPFQSSLRVDKLHSCCVKFGSQLVELLRQVGDGGSEPEAAAPPSRTFGNQQAP